MHLRFVLKINHPTRKWSVYLAQLEVVQLKLYRVDDVDLLLFWTLSQKCLNLSPDSVRMQFQQSRDYVRAVTGFHGGGGGRGAKDYVCARTLRNAKLEVPFGRGPGPA